MSWMGRRLADFEPLRPPERKLVAEMGSGMIVEIGADVPLADDADRRLRASFLRYLALGGCDACRPPDKGVRVRGAHVEGDGPQGAGTRGLDFEGCTLPAVLLLDSCYVPDRVHLAGAKADTISFDRSRLAGGIWADQLEARSVFLRHATVLQGLRLGAARLAGDLDCGNGTFHASGDAGRRSDAAIFADGVEIGRCFIFPAEAAGEIRLIDARLGSLSCVGGMIGADSGAAWQTSPAITADGLEVSGAALLRPGAARGEVRLRGAKLGGDLECDGGTFQAMPYADLAPRPALNAAGLTVDGSVFLGVVASGEVNLRGARLGGDLSCDRGAFRAAPLLPDPRVRALNLAGVRVEGSLFLRSVKVDGVLDLTGGEVGILNDAESSWPARGSLVLDRFRYGAIVGGPVDAARRLEWLARQDPARWGADFWPQPYEQLAGVLRGMGHEDEAKTVLIEKQRRLRAAELRRLPRWRKPMHWGFTQLLRLVGYGYRPALALVPALAVVLLGWAVITRAADARLLVPARPAEAGAPAPVLVPLAYSVEAFVPIVKLGQTEAFRPDMRRPWGYRLQVYLWLHGFAGWLIGGIAAAGILGLFRRA
jgi:hypothetical protein